jgi:protein O-GlcNAc transferase
MSATDLKSIEISAWKDLYAGQWVSAENKFEQILTFYPEHEKSLEGISTALIRLKKYEKSLDRIHRSLEINVTSEKLSIAGYAFLEMNKPIEAMVFLAHACGRERPKDHWKTWFNDARNIFAKKFKDIATNELSVVIEKNTGPDYSMLETHPSAPLIKFNRKYITCSDAHQLAAQLINHKKNAEQKYRSDTEAKAGFRLLLTAAIISPNETIYSDLAVTSMLLGRMNESIRIYLLLLWKWPENVTALANFGATLSKVNAGVAAVSVLKLNALLQPQDAPAWGNLAASLCQERRSPLEAERAARKSIEIDPRAKLMNVNLSFALREQGRIDEAVKCLELSLSEKDFDIRIYSSLMLSYLYLFGADQNKVAEVHKKCGQLIEKLNPVRFQYSADSRVGNEKIKIGLVSADFLKHPVANFIEPWLKNYDKEKFEIYFFNNSFREDNVTDRLKSYINGSFKIADLNDDHAADLINKNNIDILFDLSGHTANHRLPVFARKPAPIQISHLGYAHTSGLSTIDYRISDQYLSNEATGAYFVEKEIVLPLHAAYQPCVGSPEDSEAERFKSQDTPALKNGYITFGCFNNFAKINDAVLDVWAAILLKIANSKIIIEAVGMDNDELKESCIKKFAQRGISVDRLTLIPRISSNQYVLYHAIDIALDPFPYNGGTTNADLLWMGIPLASLEGEVGAGRLGHCFLNTLSRGSWVAKNAKEYIDIACNLSKDIEALNVERKKLWLDCKKSPLLDGAAYARNMENALSLIWRDYMLNINS